MENIVVCNLTIPPASEHDVLIITGATASGKSALALDYAQKHNGVIINADSMQLYCDAPILTAQPSATEQSDVPHCLYGFLKTQNVCGVARWVELVCVEIRAAWQRQRVPIVVGGTGMYVRALLYGLSPIPETEDSIRQMVRALSTDALHIALCTEDAVMASRLHPTDTQRMARALEVIRSTGISLSAWQDIPPSPPLPEANFKRYVTEMPRPHLYQRINARVGQMMDAGAMEEVKHLHGIGYDRTLPLMRAVGVAELLQVLDGSLELDDAITAVQTNTRHYAKRQLTWMRQQFPDWTRITFREM
jgi:tRNA dimethylallyltransferase